MQSFQIADVHIGKCWLQCNTQVLAVLSFQTALKSMQRALRIMRIIKAIKVNIADVNLTQLQTIT